MHTLWVNTLLHPCTSSVFCFYWLNFSLDQCVAVLDVLIFYIWCTAWWLAIYVMYSFCSVNARAALMEYQCHYPDWKQTSPTSMRTQTHATRTHWLWQTQCAEWRESITCKCCICKYIDWYSSGNTKQASSRIQYGIHCVNNSCILSICNVQGPGDSNLYLQFCWWHLQKL